MASPERAAAANNHNAGTPGKRSLAHITFAGVDDLRTRRRSDMTYEDLAAENDVLVKKVIALEAKLAAQSRESVIEATINKASYKRWSTLNIFLAFMAGGVFVLADSKWAESQFTAGALYAFGCAVLVIAVPALHATGLVRHSAYRLFQPFQGGVRFVVLQALSWAFYAIALCALLFAVMYGEDAVGFLWGGGILGIVSQILMASSLHVFVAPLLDKHVDAGGERDDGAGSSDITSPPESCGSSAATTPKQRLRKRSSASFLLQRAAEQLESTPYQCLTGADGGDADEDIDTDAEQKNADKMDHFAELLTMNFLLIVITVVLSAISEIVGHALPAALSLVVTCLAVCLTHGIGGRILDLPGWTFFQPFAGGTQFVLIQAVTWALFALSLACQLAFLYAVFYLGVRLTMGLMHIGGIAAFTAEILCMLSFRYYRANTRSMELRVRAAAMAKVDPSIVPVDGKRESLLSFLTVLIIWNCYFVPYCTHLAMVVLPTLLSDALRQTLHDYTFGVIYTDGDVYDGLYAGIVGLLAHSVWITNFSIVQTLGAPRIIAYVISPPWMILATQIYLWDHQAFAMVLFMNTIWLVYSTTYIGDPDKGKRCRMDRKWLQTTWVWDTVAEYFSGRVLLSKELQAMVDAGNGPADPNAQFMVGYHPHGIVPCGMVWGSRCSEWRAKLPGFHLAGMTASIMHYVPFMRDIMHWAGIREVSKKTLEHTLQEGLNPCIVVGGQSELFLSRSWSKDISVVAYHNGFFKIAQERQLPLIPLFAFGETKIYDNVNMPTTQRWFKDRMGFPFPFLMIGRWGLPLPRRKQIIITLGAPVVPEPGPPTPEAVEKLKKRYFNKLNDVFNEFKGPCGYDDHRIELVWKRE